MKVCKDFQGFSLVELLVTVAILSIFIAIVFPQFASILHHSTSTSKNVKTDIDLTGSLEQMFKDTHSAGFGLPVASNGLVRSECVRDSNTAVAISASSITIRSTASGDRKECGGWGIVRKGLILKRPEDSISIPENSFVMVIDTADSELRKLGIFKVLSNGGLQKVGGTSAPTDVLIGKLVYWIPTENTTNILECYETTFSLDSYQSDKPFICADGTSVIRRNKNPQDDNSRTPQPVLDCVLKMAFRVGCFDKKTDSFTWRQTACENGETLKLVRVGTIVQASQRNKEIVSSSSEIRLFKDLGPENVDVTTLNEEARHYQWKTIEKTIYLPNVE